MTLPSDWKMGKCLEWYTDLPFPNRDRRSPTFLIQNRKCCFLFSKNSTTYFVYLKPTDTDTKLEPFSLVIYSDYYYQSGPGVFNRSFVKFSDYNKCIHVLYENTIKNSGQNFLSGIFVRFCFVFEDKDGPLLPLEIKIDEKSTQADLVLSLQTDVEYLSLDFTELLKTGDHSDVQLLCNGGNIPAHKAVLAARSKAFSDMFRENTEENKNGLINLTTTEKSVMQLCLEFIYKDKISNLPIDKASNLYVLGHVFKISSLAKTCADLMVSNLCEDNYITFLVLADKYDDDYFKCGPIDYICEHTELLKSEDWMKFSDQHMKTAIDVYRKCMFK